MTSSTRAVLFVGPSVDDGHARQLFPGDVRPPIKRGDLDAILAEPEPPGYVGIVDGQFLHALAISPKEVLRAIDRGIEVFGSSSMGALRAAECAPFGMVGIGRIFHMYARGELEADDEVAVAVDPDTLRAVSEPMVNIRIAIRAAVERGVVTAAAGDRVTALAASMYFPSRSYANVLTAARREVDDADLTALTRFLGSNAAPDQKRTDAIELIHAIRGRLAHAVVDQGRAHSPDEEAGRLRSRAKLFATTA